MENTTKSIIKSLAQEKLSLSQPVKVEREWLLSEGSAYIAVFQDNKFKFQVPCEPNEKSIEASEKLIEETLVDLGYKINLTKLN